MRFINSATAADRFQSSKVATSANRFKDWAMSKVSARIKSESAIQVVSKNFWLIIATLVSAFIGVIAAPVSLLFAVMMLFITTRSWLTPLVFRTKEPAVATRLALCIFAGTIIVSLVVSLFV